MGNIQIAYVVGEQKLTLASTCSAGALSTPGKAIDKSCGYVHSKQLNRTKMR